MSGSFASFNDDQPKKLEIVEYGSSLTASESGKHLSFGVLIKNPNDSKRAIDISVRFRLLNAENFIVASEELQVDNIGAGLTVGVGKDIYDVPNDADHYQITVNCNRFIDVFEDNEKDYQSYLVEEDTRRYSKTIKCNLRTKNITKPMRGDCHIIFRNEDGAITGGSSARFYDLSNDNDVLVTFNVSSQLNTAQKNLYVIFD